MNATGATYRKLPGRNVNFFGGRSQLWLAEDHLLEVTGMLLAERYRRFPLADIRALVVESTRTQTIALSIFGVVSGLGAVAAAVLTWNALRSPDFSRAIEVGLSWAFAALFGILTFIALLGLVISLARGATCRCLVQTAPTRHRGATRLLAALAAEITSAQTARP